MLRFPAECLGEQRHHAERNRPVETRQVCVESGAGHRFVDSIFSWKKPFLSF